MNKYLKFSKIVLLSKSSLIILFSKVSFNLAAQNSYKNDMHSESKFSNQVLNIASLFEDDTLRIKTLHCLLFPKFQNCQRKFTDAFLKLREFEKQKFLK